MPLTDVGNPKEPCNMLVSGQLLRITNHHKVLTCSNTPSGPFQFPSPCKVKGELCQKNPQATGIQTSKEIIKIRKEKKAKHQLPAPPSPRKRKARVVCFTSQAAIDAVDAASCGSSQMPSSTLRRPILAGVRGFGR